MRLIRSGPKGESSAKRSLLGGTDATSPGREGAAGQIALTMTGAAVSLREPEDPARSSGKGNNVVQVGGCAVS